MKKPTGCGYQGCRFSSLPSVARFAGACDCKSEVNEALKLVKLLREEHETLRYETLELHDGEIEVFILERDCLRERETAALEAAARWKGLYEVLLETRAT